MKVITQNAEALLFEQVELMNHQPREGWHCIYFKVPTSFDIRNIANLFSRTNGNLYHFSNGESYILFRGTLKPVEVKLARYFWGLDNSQAASQIGYNIFTVINLLKDWQSFYKRCEMLYLWKLVTATEMRTYMEYAAGSVILPGEQGVA